MRAVSTVLDVSLCLLFVAASALTLVGMPVTDQSSPAAGPDSADQSVEVLTTATASVSYGVGDRNGASDRNRTAHDTLAGLLASAALADASRASVVEFRNAVTRRVARELRHLDADVQVVAEPDPDSTANPALAIGPQPPSITDVHAARVEVRGVRLTVRTWSR